MNSSSKPNRPIVGVKIAPPSQTSHLITRTRLNSWMREAIKSPFTFIISPAGYGKTSTVLSWAASLQNTPLGWLTLEREENSLDRFWTYFGAAIQTMLPHASLPEATGSSFATAQSTLLYLDELICTVAAHPEHVILVLEDLHTISGEDVLESLSYFMLHIPSNIHFVVTSRRTPDFKGYCKLKAAGLLVEIGESDLRFSRAETRELFRKASQEISDSVLDEIVEITKGWPIAIKFIMLSPALQSDEPHTSDLRVETDLLCDYCTQEILSDLPLELKEFMLKSATIN
ncbi:MAG: hypothetical protein RR619_00925, partial [Raoultibacter sp.]